MSFVVKDVISGDYFTKDDRYRDRAKGVEYAHVFDTYGKARYFAEMRDKEFNAQHRTYRVLLKNGKWDPSWPIPKSFQHEVFELGKSLSVPYTPPV